MASPQVFEAVTSSTLQIEQHAACQFNLLNWPQWDQIGIDRERQEAPQFGLCFSNTLEKRCCLLVDDFGGCLVVVFFLRLRHFPRVSCGVAKLKCHISADTMMSVSVLCSDLNRLLPAHLDTEPSRQRSDQLRDMQVFIFTTHTAA